MRRIGYMMLTIITVIIVIPIVVLKGAGQSPKAESPPQKDVVGFIGDAALGSVTFDEKNGGGPKITVYIAEKDEIQEMFLEEYIRGVVSGEMPAEFELEALKAQAVAARTYAIARMKAYGGSGCTKHPEADICTDATHCQEWISKEDRIKAWEPVNAPKYWDKITKAVEETRGAILTYDAIPVMYPLYFSTSSGKTENSRDVFKGQYPYLVSVTSPNEEISPKFLTKATISNEEFVKKFSESQYKIKLDKNKLSSQVKIIERTEGGSVKTVKVGTKTIEGTEMRKILSLNSANFTIEFNKNDITFTVLGNGHGVGMSQWGATAMAASGKNYEEILEYYYQGTKVNRIEDIYK
ncbi:amidase enhancer precursor [Oxobacter pfennigii]|uniref:Amidase enhancer n=1 Tax=Oxobacter pfennigii TaxID=36849 RepID=A0A0N8NTE7_9CLOT|nr:stage II sporulation protein D [Oxobacter pfennigii]KPU44624.1 amidase enhancer precursor [Oxobacter pfennigii]